MVRAFISYNSHDRGFVEQLAKDLKANGVTPWFDRWEMLPGESLTDKIGPAILENDYFVVVISPSSVESEWVKRELGVALTREFDERRVEIIPVYLRECEIPPFLRDKVYADFTTDYRSGLEDLLRRLGKVGEARPVATTVPDADTASVRWDNVRGDNTTRGNLSHANPGP